MEKWLVYVKSCLRREAAQQHSAQDAEEAQAAAAAKAAQLAQSAAMEQAHTHIYIYKHRVYIYILCFTILYYNIL